MQFIVSKSEEEYDVRNRGPNRKLRLRGMPLKKSFRVDSKEGQGR
jgi:hypothetical protein